VNTTIKGTGNFDYSGWKAENSNYNVIHLYDDEQLGRSLHHQPLRRGPQRRALRCTTYRRLRLDHMYKGEIKVVRTKLRVAGYPRRYYRFDPR
jgi:hypothetical protein